MARSPGYLDFTARLKEVFVVLRIAIRTRSAEEASACSKSASVLLTASLERYVNDALDYACRQISVSTWDELPDGVKTFLISQIARRLHDVTAEIRSPAEATISQGNRIRSAAEEALDAFQTPKSWNHLPQHGSFLNGATAPDRLSAIMKSFRSDGITIFDHLAARDLDRGHFARSLQDMIETRHAVAHALSGVGSPGPQDVVTWSRVTFRLVREIEHYLKQWN